MPAWLQAGCWGELAGGALLLGAVVGYWIKLSRKIIAGVMAFGSGVLISALSFELMEEAYHQAGLMPTVFGFLTGALIYSAANWQLSQFGIIGVKPTLFTKVGIIGVKPTLFTKVP